MKLRCSTVAFFLFSAAFLSAEGAAEQAGRVMDRAIDAASDRIIDAAVPEEDHGSRDIAKAAARAVFNPFSDKGFDDMEKEVQKYFDSGPSPAGSRGATAASGASSVGTIVSMAASSSIPGKDAVYTKGGMRIVGVLRGKDLAISASFGSFVIPIDDFSLLMLGSSSNYFILRSGDKIMGRLGVKSVEIQSESLGLVSLPVDDLRYIVFKR